VLGFRKVGLKEDREIDDRNNKYNGNADNLGSLTAAGVVNCVGGEKCGEVMRAMPVLQFSLPTPNIYLFLTLGYRSC
jgi:hypothetical protein